MVTVMAANATTIEKPLALNQSPARSTASACTGELTCGLQQPGELWNHQYENEKNSGAAEDNQDRRINQRIAHLCNDILIVLHLVDGPPQRWER